MNLLSLLTGVPTFFCNEIFPWLFSDDSWNLHFDRTRDKTHCCLLKLIGGDFLENEAAVKWDEALRFLLHTAPESQLTFNFSVVAEVALRELRRATNVVRDLSLVCTAMRNEMERCKRFHEFTVFCLALKCATLKRLNEAMRKEPGPMELWLKPRAEKPGPIELWWKRLDLPNVTACEALFARNGRNLAMSSTAKRRRERGIELLDSKIAEMEQDRTVMRNAVLESEDECARFREIAEDTKKKKKKRKRPPAKKRLPAKKQKR